MLGLDGSPPAIAEIYVCIANMQGARIWSLQIWVLLCKELGSLTPPLSEVFCFGIVVGVHTQKFLVDHSVSFGPEIMWNFVCHPAISWYNTRKYRQGRQSIDTNFCHSRLYRS